MAKIQWNKAKTQGKVCTEQHGKILVTIKKPKGLVSYQCFFGDTKIVSNGNKDYVVNYANEYVKHMK